MKKISIITPTFNEEENVALMIDAIAKVAQKEKEYTFEHIIFVNFVLRIIGIQKIISLHYLIML